MEFSADLIDDRVWLGDFDAMANTVALDRLNITHILSVINSNLATDANDKYIRKHIRVEDVETTDLLVEFDACYDFISNALAENETNNVLIHCLAGPFDFLIEFLLTSTISGVSRSATIACMWLMRRYKLSADVALKRLTTARPVVHPNLSFAAQLYLFEQMNHQLDTNHDLYRGFQFERARAIYLDHDTEIYGIDAKNTLRQQYRQAFALPHGHAQCKVIKTYLCRQCHRELFTNADVSRHSEGVGLFDWFMKYGRDRCLKLSTDKECQQNVFTHCTQWLMAQIDTPGNQHSNSIKCPSCSTTVGHYDLNGLKCSCGRWVTPGFLFGVKQIEEKECTQLNIETTNQSPSTET